jgi:hypothetical protein
LFHNQNQTLNTFSCRHKVSRVRLSPGVTTDTRTPIFKNRQKKMHQKISQEAPIKKPSSTAGKLRYAQTGCYRLRYRSDRYAMRCAPFHIPFPSGRFAPCALRLPLRALRARRPSGRLRRPWKGTSHSPLRHAGGSLKPPNFPRHAGSLFLLGGCQGFASPGEKLFWLRFASQKNFFSRP